MSVKRKVSVCAANWEAFSQAGTGNPGPPGSSAAPERTGDVRHQSSSFVYVSLKSSAQILLTAIATSLGSRASKTI